MREDDWVTPGWGIKVDLEVDDFKHNWTALNSFLIAFKVGKFENWWEVFFQKWSRYQLKLDIAFKKLLIPASFCYAIFSFDICHWVLFPSLLKFHKYTIYIFQKSRQLQYGSNVWIYASIIQTKPNHMKYSTRDETR